MVNIVKAEIRYFFNKEKETEAIVNVTYDDKSIIKEEGIQAVAKADELVEELKRNPIYTKPVEEGGAGA